MLLGLGYSTRRANTDLRAARGLPAKKWRKTAALVSGFYHYLSPPVEETSTRHENRRQKIKRFLAAPLAIRH